MCYIASTKDSWSTQCWLFIYPAGPVGAGRVGKPEPGNTEATASRRVEHYPRQERQSRAHRFSSRSRSRSEEPH